MATRRSFGAMLAVGLLVCCCAPTFGQQSGTPLAGVSSLDNGGNAASYIAFELQGSAGTTSACATSAAGTETTPTIDPADPGDTVSGKLENAKSGKVEICVNGKSAGQADVNASGAFAITLSTAVKYGDMVAAQVVTPATVAGGAPTYGALGAVVSVGKCSEQGTGPRPTLDSIGSAGLVTGTLAKGESGFVRICADDREVQRSYADASGGGKFAFSLSTPLKTGQKISAQLVTSANATQPETYGAASDATTYEDSKAAAATNDVCGSGTRPFLQTPVVVGIKHLVGCSKAGSASRD